MCLKWVFFAVTVFFCSFSFSQEIEKDTVIHQEKSVPNILNTIQASIDNKEERVLKGIRHLVEQGEYTKAKNRMEDYEKKNSKNFYVVWLYAYTLHKNKNYRESDKKYQQAMLLDASSNDVKLDYARALYERGKFKKAQLLLESLRNLNDASKAEGLIMLANISYWQGNIDKSKRLIKSFRSDFPTSDKLDRLSSEISDATALYVKGAYEMQTDTQPLEYTAQKAELGVYRSKFFQPKLEIENYSFTPSAQALITRVSNRFYFANWGVTAKLAAGTYNNTEGSGIIGGLTLAKQLPYNVTVSLGYNIHPVLGTIASTNINVTETTMSGKVEYHNKIFLSNLEYNQQKFEDNTITNYVFWIVTQPIKFSKFSFQFGYSYGFSNAEEVFYIVDEEKSSETNYVGLYSPYFTPKEQESNSFLLMAKYNLFRFLEIGGKTNYGISAKAFSPFLFNNGTEVVIGFPEEKDEFFPSESSVYATYSLNDKFSIKGTYTYQETFFYSRDNINIELKYKF